MNHGDNDLRMLVSTKFEMEHKVDYLGEPDPTCLNGYVSWDYQFDAKILISICLRILRCIWSQMPDGSMRQILERSVFFDRYKGPVYLQSLAQETIPINICPLFTKPWFAMQIVFLLNSIA